MDFGAFVTAQLAQRLRLAQCRVLTSTLPFADSQV